MWDSRTVRKDFLTGPCKAEGGYFEKESKKKRQEQVSAQAFCNGIGQASDIDHDCYTASEYGRIDPGKGLCLGICRREIRNHKDNE